MYAYWVFIFYVLNPGIEKFNSEVFISSSCIDLRLIYKVHEHLVVQSRVLVVEEQLIKGPVFFVGNVIELLDIKDDFFILVNLHLVFVVSK